MLRLLPPLLLVGLALPQRGLPRGGQAAGAEGDAGSPPAAGEALPAAARAHAGPPVAPGDTGPARWVAALYDAFDTAHALGSVAFIDGFYRTPGGPGYDTCLDHVSERLRSAGYGSTEGLELRVVESDLRAPAWTPLAARLELRVAGAEPTVLHAFSKPGDRDRVMLPVNSPAADVEGAPVFDLDDAEPGSVLVTSRQLSRGLLRSARAKGVVAVLSSALFDFTVDPTGGGRHEDAILFATVVPGTDVPVAQISPRTERRIRELVSAAPAATLAFRAEVALETRPLRTLVAAIAGAERPDEAVAIVSHVQEPGAGDNASGAAGMAEAAYCLARLVTEGAIARPARTLVFVWGDEMRQSEIWFRNTQRRAVAGISADMLGQSPERTGSLALLERNPDPGALDTLPPDEHTPWGAGPVDERDVRPNGLSVIARTALFDVSVCAAGAGGPAWRSSENPWEGGSDHDVFLRRGVPAVLFWHFTDFTYHTGLDRMEMIDGEELRRSCVAVLAAGLAVADARAGDLPRHLASVGLERDLRVAAALAAERPEVAQRWRAWSEGAEEWLRALCAAEEDGDG